MADPTAEAFARLQGGTATADPTAEAFAKLGGAAPAASLTGGDEYPKGWTPEDEERFQQSSYRDAPISTLRETTPEERFAAQNPGKAAARHMGESLLAPLKYAKMAVDTAKGRRKNERPMGLDEAATQAISDVGGFGLTMAFPMFSGASLLPGPRHLLDTVGGAVDATVGEGAEKLTGSKAVRAGANLAAQYGVAKGVGAAGGALAKSPGGRAFVENFQRTRTPARPIAAENVEVLPPRELGYTPRPSPKPLPAGDTILTTPLPSAEGPTGLYPVPEASAGTAGTPLSSPSMGGSGTLGTIPLRLAQVAGQAGLARRVAAAGFKGIADAVEAVRRGDETALQLLRPKDVEALQVLAERVVQRPSRTGRPTPGAIENAAEGTIGRTGVTETAPLSGGGGMRRGGSQSGQVPLPDPARLGQNLGRLVNALTGGPREPGGGPRATGWAGRPRDEPMSPAYGTDRNIDTLKRYGPAGEDLAAKIRAAEHEVRGETADFDFRFRELTKGLTPEERQILTEGSVPILERRVAPPTPGIAKVVEWWNGPQGEASRIAQHVNESGSFINDPRTGPRKIKVGTPDFAPQKPLREWLDAVHAGDPEALGVIDRSMVGPGKEFATQAEAIEALRHYRDQALKPHNPGTESPRLRKLPDEVREQNFFELIPGYARNAIRSAAEHRQFRFLDPETGQPRNIRQGSGPQGDLGDRLEGIRRDYGAGDAAAAESKALDLLGRNPQDWSRVAKLQRDVGAKVGAFNALRYYTRLTSWARNLTQAPSVWAHAGERPIVEGALRLATDYNAVRKQGLRIGAVDPLLRFSDTMGVTESDFGPRVASSGQKVAGAAMSPFGFFDRQPRLLAVATAEPFAKAMTRQLNGSPQEVRVAMGKARSMDLAPDLVERLAADKMTKADMDTFTREFVDLTNVRISRSRRLPASAAAGLDRQIRSQGKNFNAEQSRSFKRINLDQLWLGNPLPLARTALGTTALGYGMLQLVNASRKKEDVRPDNLVEIIRQGGAGGVVGDMIASLIPDEKGRTRFRQQIDRLGEDQWGAFMEQVAGLTDGFIAPGRDTSGYRKSRWQILKETLERIAPAAAEDIRLGKRLAK